jgi:hypothetical protein
MTKPIPSLSRYKLGLVGLPLLTCCIAALLSHFLTGRINGGLLCAVTGTSVALLIAGEIHSLLLAQRQNKVRIAALEDEIKQLKDSLSQKN